MEHSNRRGDEDIDGAGIVAEILKRFEPEKKERILRSIGDTDPVVVSKIEEKLFNFDDILKLSPIGVRSLLQKVEHKEIALGLKTASNEAKRLVFENMTEKRREIVTDEMSTLNTTKEESYNAQRRILALVEEIPAPRAKSSKGIWA